MDREELENLKAWFSRYCRRFYTDNPADQKNILLKEQHTYHVCANMSEIAEAVALTPERARVAEAVALLHDAGRFPQYRKYRTFNDRLSANHAGLGVQALIENKVLARLPKAEQDSIIRSVALHNVFAIPDGLDTDLLLLVKMIRDADKLDIWRVFIEYYQQPDEDRAGAVALGLPDRPEYSPVVLAALERKKMVNLSVLTTLNDFKLLQLSWIFDLNFNRSLELVNERNYIEKMGESLPSFPEISRVLNVVQEYARETAGKL